MLAAQSLNLAPLDMTALILKMQQRPKLEAGIRNGDADTIVAGLLLSFGQEGVFIHIENGPDNVVLQILILGTFGILFCVFLEIDGSLDPGKPGYAKITVQYQTPVYSTMSKVGGMTSPVRLVEVKGVHDGREPRA